MIVHGNLDDWKTDCPEEEPKNTCSYCDEYCESTFCSSECRIAELND